MFSFPAYIRQPSKDTANEPKLSVVFDGGSPLPTAFTLLSQRRNEHYLSTKSQRLPLRLKKRISHAPPHPIGNRRRNLRSGTTRASSKTLRNYNKKELTIPPCSTPVVDCKCYTVSCGLSVCSCTFSALAMIPGVF